MLDFIKSLPIPVLIGSCIVIYILIGMVVSFIAGLLDDGNESLIVIGPLWIIALPIAALLGVCWIFVAPFKFGAKISKPRVSDMPLITDDWATDNKPGEYHEDEEEGKS